MEFEFANLLQYTPFNLNHSHISDTYIKFQPSTHVLVHCTYYASMFVVCRIEVEPEPESTPFVEDPDTEPRQQGKQPPLIMSIKSYVPLSLAYACLGDQRDMFFRIVEPIAMHDLSFCHRFKQTTILADIGVE